MFQEKEGSINNKSNAYVTRVVNAGDTKRNRSESRQELDCKRSCKA